MIAMMKHDNKRVIGLKLALSYNLQVELLVVLTNLKVQYYSYWEIIFVDHYETFSYTTIIETR